MTISRHLRDIATPCALYLRTQIGNIRKASVFFPIWMNTAYLPACSTIRVCRSRASLRDVTNRRDLPHQEKSDEELDSHCRTHLIGPVVRDSSLRSKLLTSQPGRQ